MENFSELSSDSEDEVFIGPMSKKESILYARFKNRKTEEFHPNFRNTLKSLRSEEYFADVSHLSSISEMEKLSSNESEVKLGIFSGPGKCSSSEIFVQKPYGHTPMALEKLFCDGSSDIHKKCCAKILSFQQFSGEDISPVDQITEGKENTGHGDSGIANSEVDGCDDPSDTLKEGNVFAASPEKNIQSSDVPLVDASLPTNLVEHFLNCSLKEIQRGAEMHEVDKNGEAASINDPGPSGNCPSVFQSPLRLELEHSGDFSSDSLQSDNDLDCSFGPEAFRIWNQQLMATKKTTNPAVGKPSSGQETNTERPVKEILQAKSVQSGTETRKPDSELPVHKKRVLQLKTGAKTFAAFHLSQANPSPLLQALQLSPPRLTEHPKTSPVNLECLDLSVDDRLPVESYFEIMNKENVNLKKQKSPKKKATVAQPLRGTPMKELSNNSPVPTTPKTNAKFATPKLPSTKKKTGIPVPVVGGPGSRHANCFNVYSSNRLQELKAQSMRHWKHVSSPVGQYIKQDPVPAFIKTARIKVPFRYLNFGDKTNKDQFEKTLLPIPSSLSHVPVTKYTSKGSTPLKAEVTPSKYRYFPSPSIPMVVKHSGPSHVIQDTSCLHELVQRNSQIPIPQLRETRNDVESEISTYQIVSPRK